MNLPAFSAQRAADELVVGMGDMAVQAGGGTLITHALGSCIAVCVFAPGVPAAAMLHFMLPESKVDARRADKHPMAFADLGVPKLHQDLLALGADRRTLTAILVGGASIPGAPTLFEIGKRNTLAARRLLWQLGVRVTAQEVGGSISRTPRMDVATGQVSISTPGMPPRKLP